MSSKTIFKVPVSVFAMLYIPSIAIIAFAALFSIYNSDIPVSSLTRDPMAVVSGHPLIGALSNIGILFWCTAAATCFFVGLILQLQRRTPVSWFLICSGVLTSVLLLDDLFMFHEVLAPDYLGLNEKLVVAGYGLAVVICVVRFRRVILGTEYLLLTFAFAFFGMSIIVDVLLRVLTVDNTLSMGTENWLYLVEDGLKLLGIVSWCGYYIRFAYQQVIAMSNAVSDSKAGV